ncbi:MAG: DUF167 family protein [Sneathiella sp.]
MQKRGVLLLVRLTPNASANRIDGLMDMADGGCRLKVKVSVVPENGKANKALIKFLSKQFGYAQRDFELVSGLTDRNKTILITGDASTVIEDLDKKFAVIH